MTSSDRHVVESLAERISALPSAPLRLRIAVAGPPGAGKSTIAAALVERLNRDDAIAALVPMDGFHLDNSVLSDRGLLARKGAPETFDAHGFVRMIERLGTESEVVIPTFDRERDIAIAGAAVVKPEHRIVVVEGNYLCLDSAPWSELRGFWDLSVFLNTPLDVLEARLVDRWLTYGLPLAAAETRARGNDLANAAVILSHGANADVIVEG
jgi:fructokinase